MVVISPLQVVIYNPLWHNVRLFMVFPYGFTMVSPSHQKKKDDISFHVSQLEIVQKNRGWRLFISFNPRQETNWTGDLFLTKINFHVHVALFDMSGAMT